MTEWARAKDVHMRYEPAGEYADDAGNVSEMPTLLLASGAGGEMVIEGTKDDLLSMLSRAQRMIVETMG